MTELVLIGSALIAVPVMVALKALQARQDNPPALYVSAPPPRVFAAIRKAISGFYLGEYHYRIVVSDPTELTLRAVMEWRERKDKELHFLYPQGFRFHQLILDVSVDMHRQGGNSRVRCRWTVPVWFFRGRVWLIQNATEKLLSQALERLSPREPLGGSSRAERR